MYLPRVVENDPPPREGAKRGCTWLSIPCSVIEAICCGFGPVARSEYVHINHHGSKMVSNGPQMRAQVLEAYNTPYAFKTLPVPDFASEHDLLIKVDAAG